MLVCICFRNWSQLSFCNPLVPLTSNIFHPQRGSPSTIQRKSLLKLAIFRSMLLVRRSTSCHRLSHSVGHSCPFWTCSYHPTPSGRFPVSGKSRRCSFTAVLSRKRSHLSLETCRPLQGVTCSGWRELFVADVVHCVIVSTLPWEGCWCFFEVCLDVRKG